MVKDCTRIDLIRNEDIREELNTNTYKGNDKIDQSNENWKQYENEQRKIATDGIQIQVKTPKGGWVLEENLSWIKEDGTDILPNGRGILPSTMYGTESQIMKERNKS